MDETTGTEIDTAPEVSESSGPVGETTEQQTFGRLRGESCLGFIAFKTRPC
jgi:hypothetical protein